MLPWIAIPHIQLPREMASRSNLYCALAVHILALAQRTAEAFRVLKPDDDHLRASEAEMRSFTMDSYLVDMPLLGAGGVLIVMGLLHWSAGCLRLAHASAFLDEAIFAAALCAGMLAIAAAAVSAAVAKRQR